MVYTMIIAIILMAVDVLAISFILICGFAGQPEWKKDKYKEKL